MTAEVSKFLATQAVSVVGVLLLVAICWLLGFHKRARVESEDQVVALAREEELGAPVAIAVDVDGRSALAEIDPDTLYLVKAQGDRLTTRRLARSMIAGIKMYRPPGKGIGARLRFSDLGIDDIRLEFSTREAPPFIERLRRGARFK